MSYFGMNISCAIFYGCLGSNMAVYTHWGFGDNVIIGMASGAGFEMLTTKTNSVPSGKLATGTYCIKYPFSSISAVQEV